MQTINNMIAINKRQAEFYDHIHDAEAGKGRVGYAENPSANILTRAWAKLRYRQQAAVKAAGIEDKVKETHKQWSTLKAGGDFLEVGCFSGSRFTFSLAELAGKYVGVELSTRAVDALNAKFIERGLAHKAKAEPVDFLALDTVRKFDLIYAHGVLHHFENATDLFDRLAALAKPNALLVFCEPSAVNTLYRLLRTAYRPFQSDAAWEWPFTRRTVTALERHFELLEGFGWGRRSLPLSVLTGLPVAGDLIRPWYLRKVTAEVAQGWHQGVWSNSFVTALYRLRDGAAAKPDTTQ
jgi:SAM-dependent methyltransferase